MGHVEDADTLESAHFLPPHHLYIVWFMVPGA